MPERRQPKGRDILKASAVGAAAGTAVALGGAIKDVPYEGFDMGKFLRSPAIGALEAPVIDYFFPDAHPVLLFLGAIATERLTVELYKLGRAATGDYVPMKFEYGEYGRLLPSMAEREEYCGQLF